MGNSAITGAIVGDSPQSQQVKGTTDAPTTASTSFVDLEEMSITITTGANPVLILFNGSFSVDATDTNVQIILDIDDTDKTESRQIARSSTIGNEVSMGISWLETMTAGSHTFKIQWRVSAGGGTASSLAFLRAMQVIELK